VAQKKTISSLFKWFWAPLSYEKIDAELEALVRVDVEKWMASLKKDPPPKKCTKELEVKCKMLRCLAEPIKPMLSDYKHTMQNLHCANRSDEIIENKDEQMRRFCQEAWLSVEQLHDQSMIQMAYVSKAWEIDELMVDEKCFNNNT
jgi:TorA maturation chaperone TorD